MSSYYVQSHMLDAATQGEDTGMNNTSAFKGVYNCMVEEDTFYTVTTEWVESEEGENREGQFTVDSNSPTPEMK